MRILLDTNVLARCIQPAHPHHEPAMRALANLIHRGEDLCLVPQVLYEHFVVCTRPAAENGGLGMQNADAIAEIARLLETFELIEDSATIFSLWRELVEKHGVMGKRAHDARIAASMMVSQIPAILTFNQRDFQRYSTIEVLDPNAIANELPDQP